MNDHLFSAGEASDPTYVNLRDLNYEWTEPARAFAESLWDRFRRFADPHFLTEIRRHFHARFWEMYLTCALQEFANEQGWVLSSADSGPDILLERDGSRVWVEAVTAKNGIPDLPDSVQNPKPNGPSISTEEKLVLRYANAVSEKYQKYLKYLKSCQIHDDDAFVIAVNGAELSHKFDRAENDAPLFLKTVYPLGAYQLLRDRQTGEIIGRQNEPRFKIVKASGKNVSTTPFLESRSRGISAILGSLADVSCYGQALGFDFELAHNPMSRAPIADFVLPAKKAWRAVLNETGAELTAHTLA